MSDDVQRNVGARTDSGGVNWRWGVSNLDPGEYRVYYPAFGIVENVLVERGRLAKVETTVGGAADCELWTVNSVTGEEMRVDTLSWRLLGRQPEGWTNALVPRVTRIAPSRWRLIGIAGDIEVLTMTTSDSGSIETHRVQLEPGWQHHVIEAKPPARLPRLEVKVLANGRPFVMQQDDFSAFVFRDDQGAIEPKSVGYLIIKPSGGPRFITARNAADYMRSAPQGGHTGVFLLPGPGRYFVTPPEVDGLSSETLECDLLPGETTIVVVNYKHE